MHVIVLFTLSLYLSPAAQLWEVMKVAVPVGTILVIVSLLVLGVPIYLQHKTSHTARADIDPGRKRHLEGSSSYSQ